MKPIDIDDNYYYVLLTFIINITINNIQFISNVQIDIQLSIQFGYFFFNISEINNR